jgi:hypothetical protein
MKCLIHVGGEREHAAIYEDSATGIRKETHTPVKANRAPADPDRFGKTRSYWYHPQEPREVTHDTFDEALCMACATGIIAATPLPDALLSLTEVQLAALGHLIEDPR